MTLIRTDQELDAQILQTLKTYGPQRLSALRDTLQADHGDVARSLSRLELHNSVVRKASWWSLNGQEPILPVKEATHVRRVEPAPLPGGSARLSKADLLFALAEAEREGQKLVKEINRYRTIADLFGQLTTLMWPEEPPADA